MALTFFFFLYLTEFLVLRGSSWRGQVNWSDSFGFRFLQRYGDDGHDCEDEDDEVGLVDCRFSYGDCDITTILDAIFGI